MLLRVLLWIWQLPQNLIALFVIKFIYTKEHSYCRSLNYKNVHFFPTVTGSCFMDNFTLGDYIFIPAESWICSHEVNIRHSYGYVLSSRILGPLWLLLIAIPRYIYVLIDPWDYYLKGFYTETFAKKLSSKK